MGAWTYPGGRDWKSPVLSARNLMPCLHRKGAPKLLKLLCDRLAVELPTADANRLAEAQFECIANEFGGGLIYIGKRDLLRKRDAEMRALRAQGVTIGSLAKKFRLTHSRIHAILRNNKA